MSRCLHSLRPMKPIVLPAVVVFVQVFLYGVSFYYAEKRSSDFPIYYVAARRWEHGENPYDLQKQCEAESEFIARCVPMVHPPFVLPLIALVSTDNYDASVWRWTAVITIVLALSIIPLYSLSDDWFVTVQSLLFYPAIYAIFYGNDAVFLWIGIFVWAALLLKNKDFLAGLALSLSLIKPHFAIILAVPLLISRPRAFFGFAVGASILILYSLALVGPSGFAGLAGIARIMSHGRGYGIDRQNMINLAGVLARNHLSFGWVWPAFVLGSIAISIYWRLKGLTLATISIALVIALFTVPHAHHYELAMLAIPFARSYRLVPLLASLLVVVFAIFGLMHIAAYVLMLGTLVQCIGYGKDIAKPR